MELGRYSWSANPGVPNSFRAGVCTRSRAREGAGAGGEWRTEQARGIGAAKISAGIHVNGFSVLAACQSLQPPRSELCGKTSDTISYETYHGHAPARAPLPLYRLGAICDLTLRMRIGSHTAAIRMRYNILVGGNLSRNVPFEHRYPRGGSAYPRQQATIDSRCIVDLGPFGALDSDAPLPWSCS